MKLSSLLLLGSLFLDTAVHSAAVPSSNDDIFAVDAAWEAVAFPSDLWKRRGGGGGGGRGGGGGSSGGKGGGSSGGDSGGSSGSSSGSGRGSSSSSSGSSSGSSTGGRGSTSANAGGSTTTGSGVRPSYGRGGGYYGGGSTVPYRAGATSTLGLSPYPFLFLGAGLAFWPGLWYHPVYLYPYSQNWNYYNASSRRNETKPVLCGCDETVECSCDDNNNSDYVNTVLGNGTYSSLNKTLVDVANVNGTDTILLNGTLPNGTTSSGGTDSPNAAAGLRGTLQAVGWWPVVATVLATIFLS